MIVGKGLLARAFEPYFGKNSEVIIYASGVSNSQETNPKAFERELALLSQALDDPSKQLIYFGSCGVAVVDPELTPYMRHKRSMESLVLSATNGLVLRLPQVVGVTENPHTLTNFLRDCIVSGEHFTVWANAERNLIDIDDIVRISIQLIEDPIRQIAIPIAATRSLLMPAIIRIFERVLDKTANCSYVAKGTPMVIDTAVVKDLADRLGINLGDGYIEHVIRKYYAVNSNRPLDDTLSATKISARTTSS